MGSVNLGIGLPKKGDKEWFLRLASKLFVDHNRISKDDIERTAIFFSDKRNFINMVRLARNADDYNIKPLLPKIRCPVLLVWGQQDRVTPIEPWKQNIHLFSNVHLNIIEESGHSPMLEKPDRFADILDRFLEKIP